MSDSRYQTLLQQADALAETGRLKEAVLLLTQAAALEPQAGEPHRQLLWIFLQLDDRLAAFRSVKKAVALEPEHPWSHAAFAEFHRTNGNREAALRTSAEAVRLAPDSPSILRIRALAELAGGKIDEARVTAERVRSLAPSWAAAHNLLGHVSMTEGKKTEAETHFRKALELDPSSSWSHHDFGIALGRRGKSAEAIDRLHEAVRLNPRSGAARKTLHQQLGGYLLAGKWYAVLIAFGVGAFLDDHVLKRWTFQNHAVQGIVAYFPVVLAGLVLLAASILSWRRGRRVSPALLKIYRDDVWRFRWALGRLVFLHLAAPFAGWILLMYFFRPAQGPSPAWIFMIKAILSVGVISVLTVHFTKRLEQFQKDEAGRSSF